MTPEDGPGQDGIEDGSGLFGPRPALVGHRGAPLGQQENTPASFEAAAASGATWVELDARLAADGTVVVHHDPTLADGRALGDLDVHACRAAGVWTLADVLAGLPAGLGVDLEVKNFPGEPDHDESMRIVGACAAVVAAAPDRPLVITSFNPLVLLAAADEGRLTAPRGLLTIGLDLGGGIDAAVDLGCAALCPHHATGGLDVEGVASAHAADLAVLVWTVDDPGRAADLARAGVDAVCTNDPAAIGPVLRLVRQAF